jgi:hypothetical protein
MSTMADRAEDQQSQSGNDQDETPTAGPSRDTDTGADPTATDHPTGEAQAAANADNEPAG